MEVETIFPRSSKFILELYIFYLLSQEEKGLVRALVYS